MSTRFNTLTTQDKSVRYRSERWRWFENSIKRGFDVLIAIIGLTVLSPLFLVVAILIKRDSPGPVFYRGARLGLKGKIFYILKFRTMYERSASYDGPRVTAHDDPRITSLGRWLRITKLNELPQLWNVLVGEMSLVGPRPEDPLLAKNWSSEMHLELLSVRPGITSPASVLFRNEEAMLQSGHLMEKYLGAIAPSKMRLDQLYIRHRSFLLDLDTLLWTFLVLLPRVKAAVPREDSLFWGPLSRLVRRHVSWFVVDTTVTLIAIGITGLWFRSLGPIKVGWHKAIVIALLFSLLYSITCAALGLNRINWSKASMVNVFNLIPAICISTFAALTLNNMWASKPMLPLTLIYWAAATASCGFIIVRYRIRLMSSILLHWVHLTGTVTRAQERVLIVGGGEAGQFLAWWLQTDSSGKSFRLVGFVDDDLYIQGSRIRGVEVLGQRDDIPALVARHDVGIILFAIHNIPEAQRQHLIDICNTTYAQVIAVPDVIGNLRAITSENHKQSDVIEMSKPVDNQVVNEVSPQPVFTEMSMWLDELGQFAQNGDVKSIQLRLDQLRSRLETLAKQ